MLNLSEAQALIKKEINRLRFEQEPEGLYEPLNYMFSLGGKRFRPALMLMLSSIYHDDLKPIIPYAIGIELFHNFTLIHDDIMDDAPLRRNKPTVYKKWGTNTAILSGDALLIIAYEYMIQNNGRTDILKEFNDIALKVCEGQQYDMEFENQDYISEGHYLNMIELKTASLIAGSLKISALATNAPPQDATLFYEFGTNLGLAFQLQDDLMDTYGDKKKFGKEIGGDIAANKKTFLLIKALELSTNTQYKELLSLLNNKDMDVQNKINRVKNIYQELDIEQITNEKINLFYEKTYRILDQLSLPREQYKNIEEFVHYLQTRNN